MHGYNEHTGSMFSIVVVTRTNTLSLISLSAVGVNSSLANFAIACSKIIIIK